MRERNHLLLCKGGIFNARFFDDCTIPGLSDCVCYRAFVMLQNEQKAHREESAALTQTITDLKIAFSESIHEQESTVTEAINNNTLVIQTLLDKLEKD